MNQLNIKNNNVEVLAIGVCCFV